MAEQEWRKKLRWQVTIFFFLSGIITATWNARIPDVQNHLGLNNAAWGVVLAALPAGLVTGLFVSSALVARFGTARISLVTSIIACMALALLGLASNRLSIMIVLFIIGFNRTIMNIALNTNSVEVQRMYDKPIVARFHGVWSLACLVAVRIGAFFILWNVLPNLHFAIIAGLCLTGVLLNRVKGYAAKHQAPEKRPLFVKPDRYLFLLGITAFFGMAAENTMFEWSVNYYEQVVKAGKADLTTGYTCFIATMTLGRLVGDKLIHRFGYIPMLLFNGLLMAAGFLLAALSPSLWAASAGFLLIGFGDASIVPIIYSMAAKSKMPPAYAITSVITISYFGFLLNPLLVGSISEALNMQWAFGLMALFSAVICILTLEIKKIRL